jgi:hypothetical protein
VMGSGTSGAGGGGPIGAATMGSGRTSSVMAGTG